MLKARTDHISCTVFSICFPADSVHRVMAAAVTLPVLLALIPGFIKHRRRSVLVFGVLGLACFITAVFVIGPHYGEIAEMALAVMGGANLIAAHIRNRSFC